MNKEIATKFVKWDVQPLESLKGSRAYTLRERLNNGGELNRDDKNWLAECVNRNTYFKLSVPVMGWRFDFSDILKKFVVKQYGGWCEYFAPDKTSLREIICGRIDQIVELP